MCCLLQPANRAASRQMWLLREQCKAGFVTAKRRCPRLPRSVSFGSRTGIQLLELGVQRELTRTLRSRRAYAGSQSHFIAGAATCAACSQVASTPNISRWEREPMERVCSQRRLLRQTSRWRRPLMPGCCISPYPGFVSQQATTAGAATTTIAQGLKWMPQYYKPPPTPGQHRECKTIIGVPAFAHQAPVSRGCNSPSTIPTQGNYDAGTNRSGWAIPSNLTLNERHGARTAVDRALSTLDEPQQLQRTCLTNSLRQRWNWRGQLLRFVQGAQRNGRCGSGSMPFR